MSRLQIGAVITVVTATFILANIKPQTLETLRSYCLWFARPLLAWSAARNAVVSASPAALTELNSNDFRSRPPVTPAHPLVLQSQLLELHKENERLRGLLSLQQQFQFQTVGVDVISRDLTPMRQSVTLAQGKTSGMRKGTVLMTPQGVVGQVVDVDPRVSKALLLTDPLSRLGGLIQRTREFGVVEGGHGDSLWMRYLPPDSAIQVGDWVITSGWGSVYPKGLLVGRVHRVLWSGRKLYRVAWVKPASDFSRLEELLCLVPES